MLIDGIVHHFFSWGLPLPLFPSTSLPLIVIFYFVSITFLVSRDEFEGFYFWISSLSCWGGGEWESSWVVPHCQLGLNHITWLAGLKVDKVSAVVQAWGSKSCKCFFITWKLGQRCWIGLNTLVLRSEWSTWIDLHCPCCDANLVSLNC